MGKFELSTVPRSLFTVDGSLHKARDKVDIASEIRKLYSDEIERNIVTDDNPSQEKVIIIYAIANVNQINIKKSKIKSCADFAEVFVDRILDESFIYNEVRVIFDSYVKGSLKAQTRIGRTGGYSTVYRVHDDEAKIGNLETKEFLLSIETKNDQTVFLSKKVASPLSEMSIHYITVHSTACDTNIPDLDPALSNHKQEEADTSIVSHAIDVT